MNLGQVWGPLTFTVETPRGSGPLTIDYRIKGLMFSLQAYTQDHSHPCTAFSVLQAPGVFFFLWLSLAKASISTVTQNGFSTLTFHIAPIRQYEGNILVPPNVGSVISPKSVSTRTPPPTVHQSGPTDGGVHSFWAKQNISLGKFFAKINLTLFCKEWVS